MVAGTGNDPRAMIAPTAFAAATANLQRLIGEGMTPLADAVEDLRSQLQELTQSESRNRDALTALLESRGPGGGQRRVTLDDRRLKVEPYGSNRAAYKDFALSLRSFVGRESGVLKEAMLKAEKAEDEVTPLRCEEWGVSAELDDELS